jgi:hypothetical protein
VIAVLLARQSTECEDPVGGTLQRPILKPSGFQDAILRSGFALPTARLMSEIATFPRANRAHDRKVLRLGSARNSWWLGWKTSANVWSIRRADTFALAADAPPTQGDMEESRKFSRGNGTRFIAISLRSVLSAPEEQTRSRTYGEMQPSK